MICKLNWALHALWSGIMAAETHKGQKQKSILQGCRNHEHELSFWSCLIYQQVTQMSPNKYSTINKPFIYSRHQRQNGAQNQYPCPHGAYILVHLFKLSSPWVKLQMVLVACLWDFQKGCQVSSPELTQGNFCCLKFLSSATVAIREVLPMGEGPGNLRKRIPRPGEKVCMYLNKKLEVRRV